MTISVLPNLHYLSITPKDTYYAFAHNYIPDYYQYISHMKDGSDGKILMTFRSGPDNFARKPVYLFYNVSGFLLSKLGINLFTGYFLLRIFFSFIKFMMIYYLLFQIFPKSAGLRKLSLFFIWFSAPFFLINPLQIWNPTITSIDPLMRTLFLPHDLLTVTFLILASIFFNKWLEKEGKIRNILSSGLFFLFATITNPAMLLTFSFYFATAIIIYLIKQRNNYKKLFTGLIIVGLITLPVYLYYQWLFLTTLPFSLVLDSQKSLDYHIGIKEFIIISGPIFFIAVFAIRKLLTAENLLSKLVITWAIIPLILFQLYGRYLPMSPERILESCFYIPLGILGAITIYNIKKNSLKLVVVILFITISIPYYYLSLTRQLTEYNQPFINIYVPNSTIDAFNWLDKNSKDESVVVSSYFSGNLLMAFSHNKILYGHPASVYQGKKRADETMAIYNINSTPEQIRIILDQENISYILFTPDSLTYEQTNLKSINNIKQVFVNYGNSIYYYQK